MAIIIDNLDQAGVPLMVYESPAGLWPVEFWLLAAGASVLFAGVLFWMSLRNQIRAVIKQLEILNGRHDHLDRSMTDLRREHYELAREFSEFRGELRGQLNAWNASARDGQRPATRP
ncbi:MAG: hypothetical protein OXP09_18090 [Gammaproteobacteria bacterium]|nr:hypothetical protein [Gammaproteobacteria bacterium]